jgi:hypothetical protein
MGQGFLKKNFRISQILFIENFSLKMHFNLDQAESGTYLAAGGICCYSFEKRLFSVHKNLLSMSKKTTP